MRGTGSRPAPPSTPTLPKKVSEATAAAIGLQTAEVDFGSVEDVVRLTGVVAARPDSHFAIAPAFPGVVRSVMVQPGDTVRKGDVLAEVDSPELAKAVYDVQRLEAEIERLLAEATRAESQAAAAEIEAPAATKGAEIAEAEVERLRTAGETVAANLLAQRSADALKLRTDASLRGVAVTQARAEVESLRRQAAATKSAADALRATLPPQHARRPGSAGIASLPGSRRRSRRVARRPDRPRRRRRSDLLSVGNFTAVQVQGEVPEALIQRLAGADNATVRVRSGSGGESIGEGVVRFLSPVIDATKRTAHVLIDVDNPSGALRPGQFVDLVVVLNRNDAAVVVPASAIVREGPLQFVFVREGNGEDVTFRKRDVATGVRDDRVVEITQGLVPGDVIATSGAFGLSQLRGFVAVDATQAANAAPLPRPATATATSTEDEELALLNWIIKSSLDNRVLVLIAALLVSIYGVFVTLRTPTDVLPDLNRPVVTIFGEAPGLAPEEVETQVTYPIETAVNGAPGVERVRSRSTLGLSIVYVEFAWGTDPKFNRQVVTERLGAVVEKLPPGIVPVMTPASSIMGEIALVSVSSETLDPMEVRTQAEFVLRPALLSIPGIAQVTVMGGELKQFRVQADPDKLRLFGLTLEEVEAALAAANQNTGGGFIESGAQELVVRNLGRVLTADDIAASLVATRPGDHASPPRAVLVRDVATVQETGPTIKRGEGSENGAPAVIMAIQKQPGADTITLTRALDATLEQLRPALPEGLRVNPDVFRQEHFIKSAIGNVVDALRDGAILVVIVLILFLLNVRTTAVTLTALPLSLITTFIVFHWLGMSVNTMTLGGLAVAIGELVDDAVVDVENVYRRLGENRRSPNPRPVLRIVYEASSEIRNPIIIGTVIVNLVFIPTFFLPGIEGRLFAPLATAYIISIFASLLVALTVTPVLASYLLPGVRRMEHGSDGPVLRACKRLALGAYAISMPRPGTVLATLGGFVLIAGFVVTRLGSEFLPPFNEGTATVSFMLQPGVSLAESNRVATKAEEAILSIPQVKSVARRTGRAEQDEHAEGVHSSEIDVDIWTLEEAEDPKRHEIASGAGRPPSRTSEGARRSSRRSRRSSRCSPARMSASASRSATASSTCSPACGRWSR
jgi:multidrug efflux pump subunit AcrA (membrane-fusion protein)